MKKYIVAKKTLDNPLVDMSIEHLIRFVAKQYRYNVISTRGFIIARIPNFKGDVEGANRFFDYIHMVYSNELDRPDFKEMKAVVDKVIDPDIGLGNEMIMEALKTLTVDYDVIDNPKF